MSVVKLLTLSFYVSEKAEEKLTSVIKKVTFLWQMLTFLKVL